MTRGPGLGMQMRGEQQMLLQPRMLQSIEMLQLSTAELEAYLREAAESNEALRLDASPAGLGRRGTWEDAEAHDRMLREQPGRGPGLAALVEEQLATADLPARVEEWVRFLAGCLDARGYLSADDDALLALAYEHGLDGGRAELARASAALQALEPRGIGARDAIEAVLLQLDPEHPDYELLCRLLEEFVEDLARNKLPGVARALGLDIEELSRLIDVLRDLDPAPVAALADEAAPLVQPDVHVERDGEGFELRLANGARPAVALDDDVVALARDRAQPADVRRYLRGKVDHARWIVEALEQRARTLERVARATFRHQRGFLEHGPGHLVPLRMGEVADELGIHVSTVSRAVAGKSAQTPWGIFALRSFFQAANGGEEGLARDDVRDRVREVVAAEDPAQPLSDDEIVVRLTQSGARVARRTVAKYRRELGIPSSYRRRRYTA